MLEPIIWNCLFGDSSASASVWQQLESRADLNALTRSEFERLEGYLRQARPTFAPIEQGEHPHRFVVSLPDGRELPTQVLSPPGYTAERAWPVILATHGGPNRNPSDAVGGALHMAELWTKTAADAGWLLVTPAMIHVVARGQRTESRLPYEIMTVEQMEALLEDVATRYNVDPDRVIATGVSLGANFSIACVAARPDRFAGVLPVSSEGDGREHLIRNLALVPSYSLQGSLDRSVRDRTGPRVLANIQRRLGHDAIYHELQDRGHESFADFYPQALKWLAKRPRNAYPTEVWRVPHQGIMPLAKRVHWLAVDNSQALARGKIASANRIEITARRAEKIPLYLHAGFLKIPVGKQ